MRRGAWHQFGHSSQKFALEQLRLGSGVGVIISPRDLREGLAIDYCKKYKEAGADILIDQQFYIPDACCGKLPSYSLARFRDTVSKLNRLTEDQITDFAKEIERLHRATNATGVIAPAVVFEAGRDDIVELNNHLFLAAKLAGDNIGIPTYRTVVLGQSVTETDNLMNSTMSKATGQNCDGWYFGFEFACKRIPDDFEKVRRCCVAGLTLANTGKPVLHAYAGPLAPLSLSFGSTGVGVGHSQNLWQFPRERWSHATTQGGGGDAPPRFFSKNLWGTLVYPDEVAMLPPALLDIITTTSTFSAHVSNRPPFLSWSRWNANKHFVFIVSTFIEHLSGETNPRIISAKVMEHLENAVALYEQVKGHISELRDNSDSYQSIWLEVLEFILKENKRDFDFLEMITE